MSHGVRNGVLSTEAQRFVVRLLATWERPKQIVEMLRERFGLQITIQAVERYDPSKYVGRNLRREFRELFAAEREKFLNSVNSLPIAHAAYRVGKLQQYVELAENAGEIGLAMAALKQAAQDLGGQFTNNISVRGTVTQTPVDLSHLDQHERDALRQLLDLTEPKSEGRAGLPSVRQEGAEPHRRRAALRGRNAERHTQRRP